VALRPATSDDRSGHTTLDTTWSAYVERTPAKPRKTMTARCSRSLVRTLGFEAVVLASKVVAMPAPGKTVALECRDVAS
jgi:hypothetical protein